MGYVEDAGAFGIKTSGSWVIYTGDLRLHGSRAADTRAFRQEAARLEPLALVCKGTRPETETPVTEEEVFANVAEAVRREGGLAVADFGPATLQRALKRIVFSLTVAFISYKLELKQLKRGDLFE